MKKYKCIDCNIKICKYTILHGGNRCKSCSHKEELHPHYIKNITKTFLIKEYIKKDKHASQIAKELNCSYQTIIRRLRSYDIPIKSLSIIFKGRKAWNKGKRNIYSKKTLKNMSKAHKGLTSWNKNIPRSQETKDKISKTRIQKAIATGKNNPNWQGGISKLPYSFDFTLELKYKIRKRDDFTCQKCYITEEEHLSVYGKVLTVHHIDYDKKNCKEDNLITLCNECNTRVNFNRKYWYEYFQQK